MEPERNLTDEDVKALIDELESRLEQQVGKGLIGLLWKAAVLGFVALAAYGFLRGDKFFS